LRAKSKIKLKTCGCQYETEEGEHELWMHRCGGALGGSGEPRRLGLRCGHVARGGVVYMMHTGVHHIHPFSIISLLAYKRISIIFFDVLESVENRSHVLLHA
jgi:hypothetical protein